MQSLTGNNEHLGAQKGRDMQLKPRGLAKLGSMCYNF